MNCSAAVCYAAAVFHRCERCLKQVRVKSQSSFVFTSVATVLVTSIASKNTTPYKQQKKVCLTRRWKGVGEIYPLYSVWNTTKKNSTWQYDLTCIVGETKLKNTELLSVAANKRCNNDIHVVNDYAAMFEFYYIGDKTTCVLVTINREENIWFKKLPLFPLDRRHKLSVKSHSPDGNCDPL